ncbi:TPA: hypothetical protein DCZ15_01120 [Candidatus Falkowbacteria bacterium]|nr:MAG: hypothetical protein UV95_C0003G0087 [Candidatus Falkowbacteria bacterium GW2011_GWF2_43_32]HBA36457.1 hypothetical protein [Candidatus Falkowbacteria bacterium]
MSEKKVKRVLKVGREPASGLSSFVERPVPTDREVANFERVVKREVRDRDIDSDLSEVYSNKKGQRVDVSKMNIKKRPSFFRKFLRRLLGVALLAAVAYFAYSYFFNQGGDISALDLKIKAPEKVLAGEEFSYVIDYHNPTKYVLSRLRLEIQYPENFIFAGASIEPTSGAYGWSLPDMDPGANASLTVTGRLIGQTDSVNVVSARLSYLPGSFTSQFKKEASAATAISGLGFRVDLDYSGTAFLNQDNEMTLIFSDVQDNRLGDFNITFSLPAEANAAVVTEEAAASSTAETAPPVTATSKKIGVTKTGGTSWQVSGLTQELGRQQVPLVYRIKQKSDNLAVKVRLEKKLDDGQAYVFWEKTISPELVASDLNLTLFLNGSKNDGAVTFGQPLNYSLTYSNRGDSAYKDVVIMAALSGEFLNWSSLQDEGQGQVQNKSILWTKNEIPELAEIKPGQEGAINFRLDLQPFRDSDFGKKLEVISYGQYSMNNQAIKGQDNKSNTIISRINSDLKLSERILYFNDDNLPVGSGSLPPRVGEKTSVRVYWVVENNLHELADTRVVFNLPSYVSWDEKNNTNVGSLYYDAAGRQVIWEIGRLPVSVYRADAEFNISIAPTEADRDKILVLSPGSTVSATDTETKDVITLKTAPKTTKLEDDEIAGLNNSGRVQ